MNLTFRNLFVPILGAILGGAGASVSGLDVAPYANEIGIGLASLIGGLLGLLRPTVVATSNQKGNISLGVMVLLIAAVIIGLPMAYSGASNGHTVVGSSPAVAVALLLAVIVLSVAHVRRLSGPFRPDERIHVANAY